MKAPRPRAGRGSGRVRRGALVSWLTRSLPRSALGLLLAVPTFAAPPADFPLPSPADYLEGLKITVPVSAPRVVLYTNKRAAFYAVRTSAANDNANQGLNVYGRKVLEDYVVTVDGARLDRARAARVDVYPHAIVRTYPDGVVEEVALLDGLDVLTISLRSPSERRFAVAPLLPTGEVEVTGSEGTFEATPLVGGDIAQKAPRTIVTLAALPARPVIAPAPPSDVGFAPGAIAASGREVRFAIAAGADRAEARALAARLASELPALAAARRDRIAGLLLDSYVETADPRFDRALAWLKASGDALVTDQAGPGIWAGLYWFNNYWGRDTFISLPGIALVTGRYEDARRILESFARFQKTDEGDPLYGRIPNRVNSPTDVIYNTADGTPWFVREAYEYVRYSGDAGFAREIYPAVRRATDGTLRYRVDVNGLLVHEDADTWMDAKLEGRVPWSPRGDRAVDVQALWHAQLVAAARLARMAGDDASAARWTAEAARVRASFRRLFVDPRTGAVADHLNADGTRDRQVRPNQIFALTVPLEPLLDEAEGARVLREVVNELTYPYGVASLSQRDPKFHPWHHDERWHYDSAYHNGTVWVWNAGPVVEALARYGREDMAYELTRAMVDQALDLGAVGTLSELVDAIPRDLPREGRIGLSGTETQAWSVAEFVRVFYQSYLGIRPDVTAGRLAVDPALPRALGTVRAVVPFGKTRVKMTFEPIGRGRTRVLTVGPAGDAVRESLRAREPLRRGADPGPLRFATPHVEPGLEALAVRVSPVARLTSAEALAAEPEGAAVLYEARDAEGDDRGPAGVYTYPTDAHYEPGILDLTGVRVAADAERYYVTLRFRRLVDPGWHPALGFQLTYAAVAFDLDGVEGSGARAIGKNAGYELPAGLAFERVVYVGAGLEVADAGGAAIATFSPSIAAVRLGDARRGEVRFAIPKRLVGEWTARSRVSVVAGGQDDGGAAGLGGFRAVRRVAEQWAGGGAAADEGASRVYDVLLP